MKTINKYLVLLVAAALSFTACNNTIERDPSPEVGSDVVGFEAGVLTVDVNPGKTALEKSIKLLRSNADTQLTVAINIVDGDDDIISVPTSVTFAKDAKEAELLLTFPDAQLDSTYTITLTVPEANQSPYLQGYPELVFTVNIATWEYAETPAVFVDGLVDALYTVDPVSWYVVYEAKVNSDGSTDYRFHNPYSYIEREKNDKGEEVGDVVDPKADQFGAYNYYPYTEEDNLVDKEKDYNLIMHVYADGSATFEAFNLGIDLGYGMLSAACADGNPGKYDKEKESVTFAAGTVGAGEAKYNDGALYTGSYDFTIYLNATSYQNDRLAVDDYNSEDIEWEEVKSEVNIFESTIFAFTNEEQKLYKAVDQMEDNPASPYKNLYCLKDAYAEGGNLAFYWDGKDGDIRIPGNQNTKLSFMKQDLYIVAGEGTVETKDVKGVEVIVFTFDIEVASKNGNSVGEFIETFSLAGEEIIFEKSDFIGNFTLSGNSQWAGYPDAAMEVEIKEAGGELFILGIDLADTVWVDFDAETGVMSIAAQDLGDYYDSYYDATYAMALYPTIDGQYTTEDAMDFAFKLNGTIQLTSTSVANGYRIYGENPDDEEDAGWFDGYYNLAFTPSAGGSASPQRVPRKIQKDAAGTVQKATTGEPTTDHLSFKGKYRPRMKKR